MNRYLGVLSVAALLGGVARADVKIVSQATVKGLPAQAQAQMPDLGKPYTVTTYYKGDKQRVENDSDKSVTISDFKDGKLYTLNPSKKTYYVTNFADLGKQLEGIPLTTTLTKAEVTSGTETKTIAGKSAHPYHFSAVMKMSLDNLDPSLSSMLPTITMDGDQWTTEAVTLPISYQTLSRTAFQRGMPAMMGQSLKGLMDKMATIKGTPLSRTFTVRFVLSDAAKSSPIAQYMPKDPIVTTEEVTSVSEDPISDALFTPPADYKEVPAPTAPTGGSPFGGAPTANP